ncbi:MAG: CHAT domain-containing protein [Bacteroidota bacterium]
MDIFYHYLSKGYPKNKALQLTKMSMINKMPYYWAPFILIGETGDI